MHEITTYEEALRKAQQIESNDGCNATPITRLEERTDLMQKDIHDLSL